MLIKIHTSGYKGLKEKINTYTRQWDDNGGWADSLQNVFTDFEQLLGIEQQIMESLQKFTDYDDPVIKLEAERKIEDEILPRTAAIARTLNNIDTLGQALRKKNEINLERSKINLRIIIMALAVTIILCGIFLSAYMTKVIIRPVSTIRKLVNDLGKGIVRSIDHHTTTDEIGQMLQAVNNLSEKLQATSRFAHEVGIKNFDIPFAPLSD